METLNDFVFDEAGFDKHGASLTPTRDRFVHLLKDGSDDFSETGSLRPPTLGNEIVPSPPEGNRFVSDEVGFDRHVRSLTQTQQKFVQLLKDWFSNRRNVLTLISGGPGSGKTYTVVETLKKTKLSAVVMAPTARIAHKINGRTIHSTMNLAWGKGSELLKVETELENENDVKTCLEKSQTLQHCMTCRNVSEVVVMDEIGMVPFWLTYWIIRYFFQTDRNVLFIAMGDFRQLKPVRSQYNIFHVKFDEEFETHRIELLESMRFSPEYQTIVDRLRSLMDENDTSRLLRYVSETYPVVGNIDANILKKCKRALAYKNKTVELYNKFHVSQLSGTPVRFFKISNQVIDKSCFVDLKSGCEVIVTENITVNKNNDSYKIINGSVLRFEEYDAFSDMAVCFDRDGKLITVPRSPVNKMIPLVPNFAGTIHKFQGETIDLDGIVFNFNGCTDCHLIYTALSRVRSMEQILAVAL